MRDPYGHEITVMADFAACLVPHELLLDAKDKLVKVTHSYQSLGIAVIW